MQGSGSTSAKQYQSTQEPVLDNKDVMAIYVEDGVLKCAPFGRCMDPTSELVFEGINPLTIDSWQHISCSFARRKYIKGQFLAVNMDPDGAVLEGFR